MVVILTPIVLMVVGIPGLSYKDPSTFKNQMTRHDSIDGVFDTQIVLHRMFHAFVATLGKITWLTNVFQMG